ncbi:actin-related protein T1-like [Perognathus longimembris pacificus]|uniref:actin-related protein T1-like n=1 Tax=Perognathus longimembris pacificus TaxID=214514 RepID=UPI0020191572|nr:actin-related protein T1-like [Perognathus longimembris pacificus]
MFSIKELKNPVVIFDNGSGLCKVGLTGESGPRSIINTVVGHHKFSIVSRTNQKKYFIGEEAQGRHESLCLHYPIQRGLVTNWDDLEKLWNHLFELELGVKSCDHPVLMTEHSFNPHESREKMVEIMFEKFDVPEFYLSNHAVGALYASGNVTGLVMDSGDGVTSTVPIYEGCSLPHAVSLLNLAGKDVTEHMIRLLLLKGYNFPSIFNKAVGQDMKEKICFVTNINNEKETPRQVVSQYRLPDGNVIRIDENLCKIPDALFTPDRLGIREPGISQMVYNSIQKCDIDIQNDLFAKIVLSGGNTLFPGFEERLRDEITNLAPEEIPVEVLASQERGLSPWIGASIIGSLSTFKRMCVTASDFIEFGKTVIQRKCF